jgi:hypothetical protein
MAVWVVKTGITDIEVFRLIDVNVSSKVRVVKIESEKVSVSRMIDVLWEIAVATDVLVVNAVDVTPGMSIVRVIILVSNERNVLPKTSVVSKVRVMLRISVTSSVARIVLMELRISVSVFVVNAVDVMPGTSIVRTVVLEMGRVAVFTVRDVLPKISVVSKVIVVLEI